MASRIAKNTELPKNKGGSPTPLLLCIVFKFGYSPSLKVVTLKS